jgi:hypothetical protein
MKGAREEILEAVRPIIDGVGRLCVGHNIGAVAYALVNLTVTYWRKTGLPDEGLHELLDEAFEAASAVAAQNAERKN